MVVKFAGRPWRILALVTVLQHLRFGLRLLARSPGFTLAAVLALALGIAVNSMAFTVYNATLFKSLPFENPAQIVHIHIRSTRGPIAKRTWCDAQPTEALRQG
jgi:hypothetical protein